MDPPRQLSVSRRGSATGTCRGAVVCNVQLSDLDVMLVSMTSMTAHESAGDFLRRFLDTYEAHDLEALWRFYSADCRFPILERFDMDPTWENYKAFMTRFIDAFPDIHHTVEKLVTDDDNIWALYTMTGTHRGPLRGMEPTGKQVRYPIVAMYRVARGLITEADFVSDDLRMMRQLGALPG